MQNLFGALDLVRLAPVGESLAMALVLVGLWRSSWMRRGRVAAKREVAGADGAADIGTAGRVLLVLIPVAIAVACNVVDYALARDSLIVPAAICWAGSGLLASRLVAAASARRATRPLSATKEALAYC